MSTISAGGEGGRQGSRMSYTCPRCAAPLTPRRLDCTLDYVCGACDGHAVVCRGCHLVWFDWEEQERLTGPTEPPEPALREAEPPSG